MTIATPLSSSTKTAPALQATIVQMALSMHTSSHVLWGHSAMCLVYLMSLSVAPVQVVTTAMNWDRLPTPRNVIKVRK